MGVSIFIKEKIGDCCDEHFYLGTLIINTIVCYFGGIGTVG